ncbi:winged helix-turn-helix domain-containing protein [Chloroflexota bacterium]
MDKTHILVVDHDPAISRLLYVNLKARGYEVTAVMDGAEALEAMERDFVDLIVLDAMKLGEGGVEIYHRVRERSQVPIVILGALGDEKGELDFLELGADDYITKPFGIAELAARIRTALRHSDATREAPVLPTFTCGDIEINFAMRRVAVGGNEVRLTPTEYSLLQHLATNADKVLTHHMLLQRVWGEEYYNEKEYLRVFIRRLRKKLEVDPENPRYIITVPWVGYLLAKNHDGIAGIPKDHMFTGNLQLPAKAKP